ncbi:bifunctional aspartate kinase/homoserine dehydrogenase I [Kordia sp. YSTF-M3]|uniref:Bifunctional aspartate kinase/homoserine dehydrogenase I n=1 Tax=Kordia aestuariivivens TaxID=2759037 RepID=A0ABR7Q421_9FLAO|nr:bifunctional aspartate kinase/homoserine dehydrogenase I [Kordia aestuariivivens]MBC8753268.1 bifunctional aspartate kinase/homoserine dehydrogenase I [Kordia aestuariivivens]
MKILKFGGKSLANGKGIKTAIQIIKDKAQQEGNIAVVLSARGNATDELLEMLEKAARKETYHEQLTAFKAYQSQTDRSLDFSEEFTTLENLFQGVSLLGDYSEKIKDQVASQGEIISAKLVTNLLKKEGVNAHYTDTRKLIKTDDVFGNARPLDVISRRNVINHFKSYNGTTVNIVTGFIGSNQNNETTTLGRNGSNYTAALLANFLDAEELQNYTHVDGIFTANPDLVADARKIAELSFNEANELATFGAHILHAKTIVPLIEKNIPLRILNTFNSSDNGTVITQKTNTKGIKSISVLDTVALINLEGRGLLGRVGVDARIFRTLGENEINVSIISQGSSERGIGLVIDADKASKAIVSLEKEFENDFYTKDVNKISVIDDVAVISIVGQDLSEFHKPYNALIKNQIVPILFNNTVSGKNVSLVVKKSQLHKAINVIHGQIFGISKKINIAVFGKGLVGGTLLDQIVHSKTAILDKNNIKLNVFAIADSQHVYLDKNGIADDWKFEFQQQKTAYTLQQIIDYAKAHHLENLIAVDTTASKDFIHDYISLVKNGFDLVSANKIANTVEYSFYQELRTQLQKYQKNYLYETNVGAGLPLIDTIKLLHKSGEKIKKIRGVFSGSLSYLFNTYSVEDIPFSMVLKQAEEKGFTEPDAREDLSGNDVARKLLILARELDLKHELSDITIQNLLPAHLQAINLQLFKKSITDLDQTYTLIKANQKEHHVLRYVGDLSTETGILEVKLISVPSNSALGQIKGSDSIFEIYTEAYAAQPLVIQGAGAGAAVTARGVFGDILRLTEKL